MANQDTKASQKAGAEAPRSLQVPPQSRTNSNCSTNQNHCSVVRSTKTNPLPKPIVSKFNNVISTNQTTDGEESESSAVFLKQLSETKNHINHLATSFTTEDEDYKLPFFCIHTPNGEPILALVDSGASLSLIDHRSAENLNLTLLGSTLITVSGFGSTVTIPSNAYKLSLKNTLSEEPVSFRVAGSPQLPPTQFRTPQLSTKDKKYLEKMNLSSNKMQQEGYLAGTPIDMIIGNDMISWIQSLPTTKRHVLPSGRLLEETMFGHIVYPTPNLAFLMQNHSALDDIALNPDKGQNYIMTILDTTDPEDGISKLIAEVSQMWKIENIGMRSPTLEDVAEKEARDLLAEFNQNTRFNDLGEFEVALPVNGNEKRLANNYEVAIKRLGSLWTTLKRGKNLLQTYDEIIQEQVKRKIIALVTTEMMRESEKKGYIPYYIPHRAVIKMTSATTKVRIVYDASSHKRDQLSLNDCVFPGPCTLQSIFGILLRARMYKYVIVADIEKAFHQVQMQEQFRDLTRFLWLKDVNKPPMADNIQVFHFRKIPFGLSCSPFLLTSTVYYFLNKNHHVLNEPTKENLYVDNALYYTNEKGQIIKIVVQSKGIFNGMGMNLREFVVNDLEELEKIPIEDRAASTTIKLLGYSWNTVDDTWTIKIAHLEETHPTKRQVASRLAETFDPLGIVCPILVPVKRTMQECWSDEKTKWNDPILPKRLPSWRKAQQAFKDKTITIPRQVVTNYSDSELRLIVFSDASQDFMGTCVYTHYSFEKEEPSVNLFCAKNKIKPAKSETWTIPILEVSAIVIGSNLAVKVIQEIRIPVVEICFLTDSAISLFWLLKKSISRPLVANRVKAFHENKDILTEKKIEVSIRHCPTKMNPADFATRGMTSTELQQSTLWFQGPTFLKKNREEWPSKIEGPVEKVKEFHDLVIEEKIELETKKSKKLKTRQPKPTTETVLLVSTKEPTTPIVPYSRTKSMRKLVTYIHRVLLTLLKMFPKRQWESYLMKEFSQSTQTQPTLRRKMARTLVIQQHYADCERLGHKPFPSDLNKYIDKDGLYRIKRQVNSSVLPQEAHEPILIHPEHILAELLVRETHELTGHLPESYTISALRTKYHIHCEKRLVKRVISQCTSCKKVNGKPFAYPNSQVLPALRTEPSVPFQHVGLDYLGPVPYIKDDHSKGKALILIYSCLVTRGARLELVPDGTTERYIETLSIVFSRSGIPQTIYSDNATTFQLAEKLLNEDIERAEPSDSLTSFLAERQIDFMYITPLSPWQGGIYERVVGLVKHQLDKVIGRTLLDYHSLRSVLAGTETMINSRPLYPHAKGEKDMVALRPIDFQFPGSLLEIPANDYPYDPRRSSAENRTRAHLEKIDQVLEQIWKFWSLGYLLHLRESKHKGKRCSTLKPKIGQVVLINTNLVRRNKWPLGIITKICPSRNGDIRSVVVKCKGRLYKRSVCQLIPLEIESLENQTSTNDVRTTNDDPRLKSKPTPPSPAIFEYPKAEYTPRKNQNSEEPNVSTDIPSAAELPIIGEPVINEEEINYDTQDLESEEGVEYQDPNMTPQQALDYSKEKIPERRTREYLPRKAKAPYINYVHATVVTFLASPRPPECCQFDALPAKLANFTAL